MDTKDFDKAMEALKKVNPDLHTHLEAELNRLAEQEGKINELESKANAYDDAVTEKELIQGELNKSEEALKAAQEENQKLIDNSDADQALKEENKKLQAQVDELSEKVRKADSASPEALEKLHQENQDLKSKLEKNPNKDLFVDGTYKCKEGKNKGKVFKFRDGYVKTRNQRGEIIPSVDVLKDPKLMEWLIARGYAGLEEVEK